MRHKPKADSSLRREKVVLVSAEWLQNATTRRLKCAECSAFSREVRGI
jgi:hypothetical protein